MLLLDFGNERLCLTTGSRISRKISRGERSRACSSVLGKLTWAFQYSVCECTVESNRALIASAQSDTADAIALDRLLPEEQHNLTGCWPTFEPARSYQTEVIPLASRGVDGRIEVKTAEMVTGVQSSSGGTARTGISKPGGFVSADPVGAAEANETERAREKRLGTG